MEGRSFETVVSTFDPDLGIARITLDRPSDMNSISDLLRSDVVSAFEDLAQFDEASSGIAVKAVILEGAGEDAFCAGGDLTALDERVPSEFRTQEPYETIESFGAPVIAAIDGYCLGGGMELALSCDFRHASETASFGQPEVKVGLIPGSGGTQRLTRLLGPSATKELCMTGTRLSAAEAHERGIVDHIHDEGDFQEAVMAFAERLAAKPPLAVRGIKDAVNRAQETSLREGRLHERRIFQTLLETEDFERGVAEFGSDGTPEWKGR
jgi:enoyl-CoA hydratase/carnithine racemase